MCHGCGQKRKGAAYKTALYPPPLPAPNGASPGLAIPPQLFRLKRWGCCQNSPRPALCQPDSRSSRENQLRKTPPEPSCPAPVDGTFVWTMPGLWSRRCSSVAAMSISLAPATDTDGGEFRHRPPAPLTLAGCWVPSEPRSRPRWTGAPQPASVCFQCVQWLSSALIPEGWAGKLLPDAHVDTCQQEPAPFKTKALFIFWGGDLKNVLNHPKQHRSFDLFFFLCLFFGFLSFLRLHPRPMEVPRRGVESEP